MLNASKQLCNVEAAKESSWDKRESALKQEEKKFFRKADGILIWELRIGKKVYKSWR